MLTERDSLLLSERTEIKIALILRSHATPRVESPKAIRTAIQLKCAQRPAELSGMETITQSFKIAILRQITVKILKGT